MTVPRFGDWWERMHGGVYVPPPPPPPPRVLTAEEIERQENARVRWWKVDP